MVFIIKKLQDACAKPEEVVHVSNTRKIMSNDSTVKFVENNGKWMWKKYDASGSVISRSPLFDSERACKENYEAESGEQSAPSTPAESAPENKPEETSAPVAPVEPEVGTANSPENSVGTASAESAPEAPVEGSVNL